MTERSIADLAPSAEPVVERSMADVPVSTETVNPEDFDLESWLGGVRPTRRAVRVLARGDLVADLERIADQIDNSPEGEDVDELVDEFDRIRAEFLHGTWFIVEKRSTAWVEKFRANAASQLGVSSKKPDGAVKIGLHQTAAQVVEPKITAAQLERLYETNQGEANKIIRAVMQVNDDLAEDAGVMTRDFSRRRSVPAPD